MSETDKLKVEMYDDVVKEKNKEYIELTCRFRETCNDIKNKDKEIERLNNKIHDISETLNETYNDRTELRNENNRLNNIINELEKYIKEKCWKDEYNVDTIYVSRLLDKLQELKGSDK